MLSYLDYYSFYGYPLTQVLIYGALALIALILIIFITRKFWCWYFKITAGIKELKKVNESLIDLKKSNDTLTELRRVNDTLVEIRELLRASRSQPLPPPQPVYITAPAPAPIQVPVPMSGPLISNSNDPGRPCSKCGYNMPSGTKYCGSCGASITD